MFTITISGPVVVVDDETDEPITNTKRLRTFDGLHSGKETCSKYHFGELTDLELKGGAVKLVFDAKTKKLRVVSEFTSARKLTTDELSELVEDTSGQWSDGIGEGCFDAVMDKRNVFIDLAPDTGGKVTAKQTDDGKPAPKKSAAKVAAGALVKAAADGDLEAVKKLVAAKTKLDTRGRNGWTPLIASIAEEHLEVSLYLIEHGASPTATDEQKWTPLMWAAHCSSDVKHQNVKLAEALLDAGAEVDKHSGHGVTALMLTAGSATLRLLDILIARGADVNARTGAKGHYRKQTPLMHADGVAAVRKLLDAGADPKAIDGDGQHTWEFHTGAAAKLLKEKAGVK
jgi:hypothetical protein